MDEPTPINLKTEDYLEAKKAFAEMKSFDSYIGLVRSAIISHANLDEVLDFVHLVPEGSAILLHRVYNELDQIWSLIALVEPNLKCSFQSDQMLSNVDYASLPIQSTQEAEINPMEISLPEDLKTAFDDIVSHILEADKAYPDIFQSLPLYDGYKEHLSLLKKFIKSHFCKHESIFQFDALFPPDHFFESLSDSSRQLLFEIVANLACRSHGGLSEVIQLGTRISRESSGEDLGNNMRARHAAIIIENLICIGAILGVKTSEIGFDQDILNRKHLTALRVIPSYQDGMFFIAPSGINLILRLLPMISRDDYSFDADMHANYGGDWLKYVSIGAPGLIDDIDLEEEISTYIPNDSVSGVVIENLSHTFLPAFQVDSLDTYRGSDTGIYWASRALDQMYQAAENQSDLLAPSDWINDANLSPYSVWMSEEDWEGLNPGIIALPIYKGEIKYYKPHYFLCLIESFIDRGVIFYANTVATVAFVWFSNFEYRIFDLPYQRLQAAIAKLSGSSNFGTTKIAMSLFLDRSPYREEHVAWLGGFIPHGIRLEPSNVVMFTSPSSRNRQKAPSMKLDKISEEAKTYFTDAFQILQEVSEGGAVKGVLAILQAFKGLEAELKSRFHDEFSFSRHSGKDPSVADCLRYLSAAKRDYDRGSALKISGALRLVIEHGYFRDFINDAHRLKNDRNEVAHAGSSNFEVEEGLNRLRGILMGGKFLRFLVETAP